MKIETESCVTPRARGEFYRGASLNQELEYLWEDCDASGKPYEIYLGKISRSPVVRSKISGRYFALPWSRIIRLAVEWGIDE
jgi:hypothetical protein